MLWDWQRTAGRRRMIVNMKSGRSFIGILWRRRGRLLVLRDAAIVDAAGDHHSLDGEVVVDVGEVEFVQIPPSRPAGP